MKFSTLFGASAALLGGVEATLSHRHLHNHQHMLALQKKHEHLHSHQGSLAKREVTCQLPNDPNIVRVPGQKNGGWALSPDIACKAGMHCPFACKPGMVMNQWEEGSTVSYPSSMVSLLP